MKYIDTQTGEVVELIKLSDAIPQPRTESQLAKLLNRRQQARNAGNPYLATGFSCGSCTWWKTLANRVAWCVAITATGGALLVGWASVMLPHAEAVAR